MTTFSLYVNLAPICAKNYKNATHAQKCLKQMCVRISKKDNTLEILDLIAYKNANKFYFKLIANSEYVFSLFILAIKLSNLNFIDFISYADKLTTLTKYNDDEFVKRYDLTHITPLKNIMDNKKNKKIIGNCDYNNIHDLINTLEDCNIMLAETLLTNH